MKRKWTIVTSSESAFSPSSAHGRTVDIIENSLKAVSIRGRTIEQAAIISIIRPEVEGDFVVGEFLGGHQKSADISIPLCRIDGLLARVNSENGPNRTSVGMAGLTALPPAFEAGAIEHIDK